MSPVKRTPWGQRSERARRIAAARILRGWEPPELDKLLAKADVGKEGTTNRLENDKAKPRGPGLEKIQEVLGVSEEWFSAPVETLLGVEIPKPERDARLAELEERVDRIQREHRESNPRDTETENRLLSKQGRDIFPPNTKSTADEEKK